MSYIGPILCAIGLCMAAFSLWLTCRQPRTMTETELIARGLWDECDGEPMNKYAEEFERRYGANAKESI